MMLASPAIRTSTKFLFRPPCPHPTCQRVLTRSLATHQDHPSTSAFLSEQLDHRTSSKKSSAYRSVGPFPLGVYPGTDNKSQPKKWSQLSPGGKLIRGTARTSNLTVILFGGALSCVLAYALATELFARNSPTVLYADACQRVESSSEVASHLRQPLVFHTNAPSPLAPRHRNRHVTSQVAIDSGGREHLLLHFWVEAKSPSFSSAALPESQLFSDFTFSSVYDWSTRCATSLLADSKKAFAYLVGNPLPTQNGIPVPLSGTRSSTLGRPSDSPNRETAQRASTSWELAGIFSRLRGSPTTAHDDLNSHIEWTGGEVHADLIKDENGDFKYRYLLVDIPHSRSKKPLRVYVEKGPGFREGEGVFLWG